MNSWASRGFSAFAGMTIASHQMFINYMLTYEAAFDNTETVGYTSPNAEVFEEMTSSEDLYAENAAYLPRSGYEKDEMFHDNQTLMRELSKLWIKVQAAK